MGKSLDGSLTENMFLDNKYLKYYNDIINNAKVRKLSEFDYVEKHHIIPKSLGGQNNKENLVKLTAREHFLCHWLLTKITTDNNKVKMNSALWLMTNVFNKHHKRYKVNSRLYEIVRKQTAKEFSKNLKGRKLSEETKRKISETRKEKIKSGEIVVNENKEKYKSISLQRKGKLHSEITRSKIGNAHRGKQLSDNQKEYLSLINKDKKVKKETKEKISQTLKNQYSTGTRKGIAGMKGKNLSADAKQKISNTHKGKEKSQEHKEKLRQNFKGKSWKIVNNKRVWYERTTS